MLSRMISTGILKCYGHYGDVVMPHEISASVYARKEGIVLNFMQVGVDFSLLKTPQTFHSVNWCFTAFLP